MFVRLAYYNFINYYVNLMLLRSTYITILLLLTLLFSQAATGQQTIQAVMTVEAEITAVIFPVPRTEPPG